jgi:hypothetical protein
MRLRLDVAVLAGMGLLLQGCDAVLDGAWNQVQEDFHYSYPLAAGGRIEVENQNGAVEVSAWDQNTVDISGSKYASTTDRLKDLRVDIAPSPNSITIRTFRADPHWGNGGVRYTIRVPRKTELARIVTSNGAINIDGIDGGARLRSSNGAIRGTGITGELEAETSNGRIEVSDLRAPATVHTSNGAVELSFTAANEVHATTSNGAITVRLPSGAGGSIHARTSNGSIQSDFDVSVHGVISKRSLDGTFGTGGPTLELSTSNGGIRVLKR